MIPEEIKQGSILLFNKPIHWTSFDVVNKVKILTKVKVGHAGTLDPLASGLLILCTGKFLKQMESFKEFDKEYTGTMILGATTPSHDLETEIDERFDISSITEELIHSTAKKFLGTQLQMPPEHSAKKLEGKRYYELARKGTQFKRNPHLVTLNEFGITRIALPEVDFRIVCGKGFYVRSLIHDFGKALSNGAYLSALCRTRVGPYLLKDAWQIEDFARSISSPTSKDGVPVK